MTAVASSLTGRSGSRVSPACGRRGIAPRSPTRTRPRARRRRPRSTRSGKRRCSRRTSRRPSRAVELRPFRYAEQGDALLARALPRRGEPAGRADHRVPGVVPAPDLSPGVHADVCRERRGSRSIGRSPCSSRAISRSSALSSTLGTPSAAPPAARRPPKDQRADGGLDTSVEPHPARSDIAEGLTPRTDRLPGARGRELAVVAVELEEPVGVLVLRPRRCVGDEHWRPP